MFAQTQKPMFNETFLIVAQKFAGVINFTLSTALGGLAGKVVIAFQTPVESKWYDSPIVAAGIVAGIIAIVLKFIERRWQQSDLLSQREKELHAQEILFLKGQRNLAQIETAEARFRAHRFGNEINRVNGHTFICHSLMSKANIDIPEFQLKSYDELMEGIALEVEEYRKTLVEQVEEVHRTI